LGDAGKFVLRGKLIASCAFVRKHKGLTPNDQGASHSVSGKGTLSSLWVVTSSLGSHMASFLGKLGKTERSPQSLLSLVRSLALVG
jgi:hypothetical protein